MPRLRINLNREWLFHRADAPADAWQPVGLPHTFDLPYFRTPEFYVGQGRYRRPFHVPREWLGRRLALEFDGVFQEAHVTVNGHPIGGHSGGYTGFSLDITPRVIAGDNTLDVLVSNDWNPRIAPRAGEHIFCGGIYRDVYLVVTDPLHIPWCGITVTTLHVSRDEATVHVRTEIVNDDDAPAHYRLITDVLDQGRSIASTAAESPIDPRSPLTIDQLLPPIAAPQLWHPDHPYLYQVRSRLFKNNTLVDQIDSPLGFRWFQWTADRGFFLNGEHLYLRGANAHQDHSGWGIAITQAACQRDARLIKEAGFNFVRGAHYPHHPAFSAACDRLGLIFWSEACFWGKGGFGAEGYWNASAYPINPADRAAFEDSAKDSLRDMIRIHRNHPSIMAWSMTNEAFFTYHLDHARQLIAGMVALSRELDPTRPAAIGGAQRGGVDQLGDIAGYNGDGARLFINPGIPNMVSEYGAISKPPDAFAPFFGELPSEPFAWRSGQAIWCAFDYGSIAGRQGLKGILQHNRLPKQSWHWYRQEYLHIEPPTAPGEGIAARLSITADKTNITETNATDDCQIIVTVLDANNRPINACPPVTLTIESGPGEFPTGRSITFDPTTDIPLVMGQAAIAFRSYHGGKTVLRATSPGLLDATLLLTTEGEPQYVEGRTPHCPPRPYRPPAPSPAALAALKNLVDVARDRPTLAASETADHPVRHINDADPATFWSANDSPPGQWVRIDLEGFYQLSGYRIVFPAPGNYRYTLETAVEPDRWRPAVDRTATTRTDAIRNDVFDPGTIARFVRLTFTSADAPAHLSALEIYGIISTHG